MTEYKYLKAWLNYNCSQGNNWVVIYKFDEIINHKNRQLLTINGKNICPVNSDDYQLSSVDLSHIYFTYMTENLLITLIETYNGQLFLIHNTMNLIEPPEKTETPKQEETQSTTVELNDAMIDQCIENRDALVKKVDSIVPLPQLESIESKIYFLSTVTDLRFCLSKKEKTSIGLRDRKWFLGDAQLKKIQKDELDHLSYMDFINISSEPRYLTLLNRYIDQSGETLNLTHNYSITPTLLNSIKDNFRVKELIIYQNFQINDFQWLRHFPNIKMINLFYNHQIEQRHFEQIVQILPNLSVFNIHFCSRINLRVLIPILKLQQLEKLAIDDSQFWCQRSVHELFILPQEWKNIDCQTLQKVAINSLNLTLDVIDYLLVACPNITQFTVDENILKHINKDIVSGFEKDNVIIFNAWQNPSKGFQIHKKVSFNNLLKDNYNSQLFSESMLKKIKEIRARKGEKEQTAIEDKPETK